MPSCFIMSHGSAIVQPRARQRSDILSDVTRHELTRLRLPGFQGISEAWNWFSFLDVQEILEMLFSRNLFCKVIIFYEDKLSLSSQIIWDKRVYFSLIVIKRMKFKFYFKISNDAHGSTLARLINRKSDQFFLLTVSRQQGLTKPYAVENIWMY